MKVQTAKTVHGMWVSDSNGNKKGSLEDIIGTDALKRTGSEGCNDGEDYKS